MALGTDPRRATLLSRREVIRRTAAAFCGVGVLAAGCARDGASTKPTVAQPTITLIWRPWTNFSPSLTQTAVKLMYEATAPFRAQNKGVDFKVITSGVQQQTVDAILAGTGPDVFEDWELEVFTDSGVVLDLEPYMQKDSVDLSVMPSGMVDYIRAGSQYAADGPGFYGMPDYLNTKAMAVNLGIVDNLGVARPSPDWTYNDYAHYARITTSVQQQRTGAGFYWGSGHGNVANAPGPWYLHAFGGGYVNPKNSMEGTMSASGSIQWFTYMTELMQQGAAVADAGGHFRSGHQFTEAIGTAASLMNAAQNWQGVNWDIYPMPTGPAGRFTAAYPGFYAISARTKYPAAAWEFVKWLCLGKTWQEFMIRLDLHGPILTALWTEWLSMAHAVAPPLLNKNLSVFVDQVQKNELWTGLPFRYADSNCGQIIGIYVTAMLNQQLSVPEACLKADLQIAAYEQAAQQSAG